MVHVAECVGGVRRYVHSVMSGYPLMTIMVFVIIASVDLLVV